MSQAKKQATNLLPIRYLDEKGADRTIQGRPFYGQDVRQRPIFHGDTVKAKMDTVLDGGREVRGVAVFDSDGEGGRTWMLGLESVTVPITEAYDLELVVAG